MKSIFYLFVLFAGVALVYSCSKEEMKYSCNEYTNNWVKANINKIEKMTMKEWAALDDSLKIPVYRTFTHKQRIDFWHQRFKEVKMLKWTKEEILHINKAELFLNNHLEYLTNKNLTDEQLDTLELFGYEWMNEGIERFKWTPQVGNLIIGSGFSIKHNKNSTRSVRDDIHCHCHAGNIIFHTCYSDITSCEKSKTCQQSGKGCGFFLQEECDGICQ